MPWFIETVECWWGPQVSDGVLQVESGTCISPASTVFTCIEGIFSLPVVGDLVEYMSVVSSQSDLESFR